MTDLLQRDDAWTALHDPATDATALASIAAAHPEFAGAIARHPNAYPELVAWARTAANTPLLGTGGGDASAGTSAAMPPVARSSALGRRWWIAAAVLLVLSAVVPVLFGTFIWEAAYQGQIGAIGPLAVAALAITGIVPIIAAGVAGRTTGRKVGGIVLAAGALVWSLLQVISTSFQFGFGSVYVVFAPWPGGQWGLAGLVMSLVWMVLLFLSWALTWPIRGIGYLGVLPLVVAAFAGAFLGLQFTRGEPLGYILGILMTVALPASAILVGLLASRAADRRSALATVAAANAHSAGYAAPGIHAPSTALRTNTMAVLSLVFAFVFSILGVVFGHIALAQIQRTGEQGRGLAVAGLIIGYISVALGIILLIWQLTLLGSLMRYGY